MRCRQRRWPGAGGAQRERRPSDVSGPARRQFFLELQHDVRLVTLSPDGKWAVPTIFWRDPNNPNRSARIWNSDTGKHVHDLPLDDATVAGFSPDSKWLA